MAGAYYINTVHYIYPKLLSFQIIYLLLKIIFQILMFPPKFNHDLHLMTDTTCLQYTLVTVTHLHLRFIVKVWLSTDRQTTSKSLCMPCFAGDLTSTKHLWDLTKLPENLKLNFIRCIHSIWQIFFFSIMKEDADRKTDLILII